MRFDGVWNARPLVSCGYDPVSCVAPAGRGPPAPTYARAGTPARRAGAAGFEVVAARADGAWLVAGALARFDGAGCDADVVRGADVGAAARLEDGAAVLAGAVALARGADIELATFELADADDAECEALADDTALDAALDTGATLDTAVAPSSDHPQADAPSVTASTDPATAPARRHDAPRPNPASPFMGPPPSSRPSTLDGLSS